MLLENIKNKIFQKYKKNDVRWIFLSFFDKNWNLLASNWVIETDKNISDLLDTLWLGIFEMHWPSTSAVSIDIVLDSYVETNISKLLEVDIKNYWILISNLDWSNSGVILPNIVWIADIKHAIQALRQKYPKIDGNVNIIVFKTDRLNLF